MGINDDGLHRFTLSISGNSYHCLLKSPFQLISLQLMLENLKVLISSYHRDLILIFPFRSTSLRRAASDLVRAQWESTLGMAACLCPSYSPNQGSRERSMLLQGRLSAACNPTSALLGFKIYAGNLASQYSIDNDSLKQLSLWSQAWITEHTWGRATGYWTSKSHSETPLKSKALVLTGESPI